jgi:hypothetical protein
MSMLTDFSLIFQSTYLLVRFIISCTRDKA